MRIASCQFPVSSEVAKNAEHVRALMKDAAGKGARLVHFSEAALSGYCGVDFYTWDGYDWDALRRETQSIQRLAKELKVWTVLGSSHFLGEGLRPTNCLYIIGPDGDVVDRYDKSMLTDIDQLGYTAGTRPLVMDLDGIQCGFLICYDVSFPEMYARYRAMGVQLVFHAFHNASFGQETVLDELGHAWLRVRAADNKLWIVANNNAKEHQAWPSCIVRPDGTLADVMERHATGMLVHDFPDETLAGWTHNDKPIRLAADEVFRRGETVSHPRLTDRKALP